MNRYLPLKVYGYYHHEINARENEWKHRLNSPFTYKTNLLIKPESRKTWEIPNEKYPLFLVLTPRLYILSAQVHHHSLIIKDLVGHLLPIAKTQFFDNCLAKEIKSTNDIESVHTTTREIITAIKSAKQLSGHRYRLQSFAYMYLQLLSHKGLNINRLHDIRKIYDHLLYGEIDKKKLPDGKLFRNGYVRIGDDFRTSHTPPETEDAIWRNLKNWIVFLRHNPMPYIFKLFVAHYYFEYTHPFYDGNGRTGRYILDMGLAKELDSYTAASFSTQVNAHKSPYYKALSHTDNIDNFGETTFMVQSLLKIVNSSQQRIISNLRSSIKAVSHAIQIIHKQYESNSSAAIMITLFQQRYFGNFDVKLDSWISRRRLIRMLRNDFSGRQVKSTLNSLAGANMLEIVKKRPLCYIISNKEMRILD